MYLLELVMQGVRGFKELVRLRFQPAFNIVIAGNEMGKTASVDTMQRMLFPSNQADSIEPLISRLMPDASRAAVVVCSDDGSYYRTIQDLSKRAVNLSKYNASTKDFALMYKEWDAAVQFMGALMSGITEEEYARLFIFRREQAMNSPAPVKPEPAQRIEPIRRPPAATGRTPVQETRLNELREVLRKAEEAADADYKLDSAKIRLAEIKKKLESLDETNARVSDAQANVASLKGCENLPENLGDLIEEHERNQSEKMVKSDELQQDITALKADLQNMPQASVLTDKLFLFGAVVGVGALIAGLFILTEEQAMYFPVGVLVSIGLMSAGWYKGSRKSAQKKLIKKEVEGMEADLAELEESFNKGGEAIMACMKATGSSTAAELKDKAENYHHFSSLLQETIEQRQFLLGGTTVEALQSDYNKQQEEVIELEKAARALSRNAVDTYSIRQEIERIESESAGSSLDFGMPAAEVPVDFSTPQISVPGEGGTLRAELTFASRVGEIEMDTLIPAVEAAAQRNLSAVTAGRYVKVEAGQESAPSVYDKHDVKIGVADLSRSTQELLYFCLRVGLVEALAGKLRLPFILDDPLAGLDPARQHAACQILRTLGSKTQVILFTSNPSLRAGGDTALELK